MQLLTFIKKPYIKIVNDIGERSFESFLKSLEKFLETGSKELRILVHSDGGCVLSCLSKMRVIKDLKAKGYTVSTFASGRAQSAGFLLFMMGDNRYADNHVELMHHKMWTTAFGATEVDLEKKKKAMKRLENMIAKYVTVPLTKKESKLYDSGEDVEWTYRQAKKKGIVT